MMTQIAASIKNKFAFKPIEVQRYRVTFLPSNESFAWDGRYRSLLELAQAHGIVADSDCRSGYCGTCVKEIVAGEVAYTGKPAAAVNSHSCLLCISVPKTDLILKA
ncbi:MAG: hypothetical protein COW12_02350 [Candidatus Omnitrophica bacterium CG12_big_fil_rev_8_21_14_0_65_45_16]|nr:MAG: hypothetical protein COW12_02350 [Candidatus Omnitrophica bacterium CG12_big_fil_rev_8_21_14_0_65_45_16]